MIKLYIEKDKRRKNHMCFYACIACFMNFLSSICLATIIKSKKNSTADYYLFQNFFLRIFVWKRLQSDIRNQRIYFTSVIWINFFFWINFSLSCPGLQLVSQQELVVWNGRYTVLFQLHFPKYPFPAMYTFPTTLFQLHFIR